MEYRRITRYTLWQIFTGEIVENINEPKIKSGKQELLEKYISIKT